MAESYVEREVKLDVDSDFVVPNVCRVLAVPARIEVVEQRLESRYFDTESHDLLNARMTLRRRLGTDDRGWQLKVPNPPAREEIRVGEGGEDVPAELRQLLLGVTREASLLPLATITTERTVHRVLGDDGEALAEIADDRVHAVSLEDGDSSSRWREIEVELRSGDEALAQALVKLLRKAGARRASTASKLARALDVRERESGAASDAAGALLGYMLEQQRAILAGDVALRRGHDGAVHETRVAVRRLRSVLRSYGKLFQPGSTRALEESLRWYAELLGRVRDRQVLRRRLIGLIDELPAELVLGPVRERVESELRREQAEHWSALQAALTGPRYLELLRALADWLSAPPWSLEGNDSIRHLEKLARRTERKAARRLEAASESGDVTALHGARKAAKRARYAYEVLEPVTEGNRARKRVKRQRALQDLIGEHQDSQLGAEMLLRLVASLDGSTGTPMAFTLGVLYERERELARAARKAACKR
jgi:CHAD domain-containing protein